MTSLLNLLTKYRGSGWVFFGGGGWVFSGPPFSFHHCLDPIPYNIYPHPPKSAARISDVDSAADVLKLFEKVTRFFRTFHFCHVFLCAQVHLTVMIACLRRGFQLSSVNFCAQAADLVSTICPIWAFGIHFLPFRCRRISILAYILRSGAPGWSAIFL